MEKLRQITFLCNPICFQPRAANQFSWPCPYIHSTQTAQHSEKCYRKQQQTLNYLEVFLAEN